MIFNKPSGKVLEHPNEEDIDFLLVCKNCHPWHQEPCSGATVIQYNSSYLGLTHTHTEQGTAWAECELARRKTVCNNLVGTEKEAEHRNGQVEK